MSEAKGCCGTCGFVGLTSNSGGPLHELRIEYRQAGQWNRRHYEPGPECLHGRVDFYNEAIQYAKERFPDGTNDLWLPEVVKYVLAKDRTACDKWWSYLPGLTPEEHAKMTWHEIALDAKSRSADAQAVSADAHAKSAQALDDLRAIHKSLFALQSNQATKNDEVAVRLQILEKTRYRQATVWGLVNVVVASVLTSWLTWFLTRH